MPTTTPFEEHTERYERWFEEHPETYESELAALSRLVSPEAFALEVGVGTGRFAAPLGVEVGLDPAVAMLVRAEERGVTPVRGVAEALPFRNDRFDLVLFVTTICFVDDLATALAEARRVLGPDGALVLGYVDAETPVGRRYQRRKMDNPFYRDASFVSTDELLETLASAGSYDVEFVQTVFEWPDEMASPDPVREGHGDGSFVVLRAEFGG